MMTTTEQGLETSHLPADPAFDPRSRRSSDAGARGRLTLALAGFAALLAWGFFAQLDDRRAEPDQAGRTAADHQPQYDGHGKWGGYASQ